MQKSGFFNALLKEGIYDRTYNANDYCDNLAVIISNGVLRSENDDLKVTADGLTVTVGVGRAWINGHFYHNDTPHTFAAVSAPAGGIRYDRVILRLDTDIAARNIELVYREGIAANFANAKKPEIVRNDTVFELVLADILIDTNGTSAAVADTRGDNTVCGWVYSVSGDGSFFATLDNTFAKWFAAKKDTLSSVTLFKRYNWRTVTETAGNTFTFNIPQYDEEVCFLEVYTNGILETEGDDYTVTGNTIIFTGQRVAGTEIEVKVFKSIDGTGIMSVADEITEIQNTLANINAANNYFYNCNGYNDNVVISQIAQAFLDASTEAGELTITVVGDFGATAPAAGDGTAASPYVWFDIGKNTDTKRRVTLDFSGCPAVNLTQNAYYYNIFRGSCVVKNLCLNVSGVESVIYGQPAFFANKNVYFENCRIFANVKDGWLFNYGTFRDCEFTIKTTSDKAAIFRPLLSSDVLRIYGGRHLAYTSGNYISAVVYCTADISSAVIIADGLNCPTVAENGYQQTHAVYDLATSNYHRYLNTVSELILHAPSQTVRDTIVANK